MPKETVATRSMFYFSRTPWSDSLKSCDAWVLERLMEACRSGELEASAQPARLTDAIAGALQNAFAPSGDVTANSGLRFGTTGVALAQAELGGSRRSSRRI